MIYSVWEDLDKQGPVPQEKYCKTKNDMIQVGKLQEVYSDCETVSLTEVAAQSG